MTKFILHGGVTRKDNYHNRRFYEEIVKGLKSPVKVLDITFARKKSKWRKGIIWDKKKFERTIKNKKIKITQASEKSALLRKQIKECDIVFIIGGLEIRCLKRNLKKLKDFKKLIRGKVVMGSSAGAYVLSKYYYTHARAKVEKGLGILPIKTIAHYGVRKDKKTIAKLENTNGKLKIIKIPETQYKVIKAKI